MGNILCRDKTPRRVFVKGQASSYDPHLFATDSMINGTRKDQPSDSKRDGNHIFYSTPNLNNDMRSTISLDARIFDSGNFKKNPPIAPPRRKRTTLKKGSTLPSSFSDQKVKNGFKDVFGNSTTRSLEEIEYIDSEENSLHDRSSHPITSTPEKKLRVGNKKSDKFFGEDLSDRLSDEPVADEIDAAKSETDKKLSFFLMNMLDDIRDQVEQDKYRDKEPIEEPVFIARKRITKHICDDDDHHHDHHLHYHEKENIAPPKPDRDFSKFKADSLEDQIEKPTKIEDVQTKVIIRRGISRDSLPSPPETPRRKTGASVTTPTITIETIELSMTERRDESDDFKKSTESIKEEIESNSHKITNMVDEMIKKAYGIGGFNPEDCSHHTHDELVTPTSKLAVRKISTGRKSSTESAPSIEDENIKTEVPSKSPSKEDKSKIDNLVEESRRKFDEIDEAARVPKNSVNWQKDEASAAATTMNDIIDEIYSRNSEIMKEFQSFLEQSIEKDPAINVEEEKKFVDRKEVMNDFKAQIVAENEDLLDDELEHRRYSDSFESTDEEQHDKRVAFAQAAKKRSSIKDCDNWFNHHVELEETESEVCNNVRDLERHPVGYDYKKIFPFGSTITGRRDSLSDEFFSEVSTPLIKLPISTVRESESSVSEDGMKDEEQPKAREERSSESPDHSVLFKYIDKSANESIVEDKK